MLGRTLISGSKQNCLQGFFRTCNMFRTPPPPIKYVKVTSIKNKLLSALIYTGNLLEGLGLMKGFTFQAVISSPFSIDSFFVIRYEYQETRSQTCDVTLKNNTLKPIVAHPVFKLIVSIELEKGLIDNH